MGLFKKRDKKKKKESAELPELPRISKLPELPKLKGFDSESKLPQLPSYPSTELGNKFSQHTIKEAVTGGKEDRTGADEFVKEQMMPHDLKIKPLPNLMAEMPPKFEKIVPHKRMRTKQKGPVFIRIDKFEESLDIFEEIKEKISGMESLLQEIKETKAKEENELSAWEAEIQTIKNQTEKVERDIFSKIE